MSTAVDYGRKYKPARQRLYELLVDGCWHSHKQLELVAGNRYSARLLELKRLGCRFESRFLEEGGGKVWRLLAERGRPQGKRVKVFLDEADAAELVGGTVTLTARSAVRTALNSFRQHKEKL